LCFTFSLNLAFSVMKIWIAFLNKTAIILHWLWSVSIAQNSHIFLGFLYVLIHELTISYGLYFSATLYFYKLAVFSAPALTINVKNMALLISTNFHLQNILKFDIFFPPR
jgi:hypothetical protein